MAASSGVNFASPLPALASRVPWALPLEAERAPRSHGDKFLSLLMPSKIPEQLVPFCLVGKQDGGGFRISHMPLTTSYRRSIQGPCCFSRKEPDTKGNPGMPYQRQHLARGTFSPEKPLLYSSHRLETLVIPFRRRKSY